MEPDKERFHYEVEKFVSKYFSIACFLGDEILISDFVSPPPV